jgi:hypothetical protein
MRRLLAGFAVVLGLTSVVHAGGGPPKPPPKTKPPTPAPAPAPAPTPAADPNAKPAGKNWSGHTGNLKFVVGFDAGMDQAWEAGRPAMLFFTSSKDKWCPIFGTRTWTNKGITDKLSAYLPVLVDADDEKGKERVKYYTVLVLPAVVWVTSEGSQVFAAQGDIPSELFDKMADIAKERAPDVKRPEELDFIERVRADFKKATDAGNVRKMLDAATALATLKRPKSASEEGAKLLADLDAKGRARLDAAKKALADGKTADANAEFAKLASEYRGRDVGREAAAALPKATDADGGDK